MRERDRPARRRVLLDQQTRPFGLVQRCGRLGRAGYGGRIGQDGMLAEHRRGHHQVTGRPCSAASRGRIRPASDRGARKYPPAVLQLVIGQLVEQRADQQRVAAGVLGQPPYRSLGKLRPAEPSAQQAQLSGIRAVCAERSRRCRRR